MLASRRIEACKRGYDEKRSNTDNGMLQTKSPAGGRAFASDEIIKRPRQKLRLQ